MPLDYEHFRRLQSMQGSQILVTGEKDYLGASVSEPLWKPELLVVRLAQ